MQQIAARGGFLVLAASLASQGDYDLDKTTAGTLGGTLSLQVRNAEPNRLFLVMMSFSSGPTAIAQFDPPDTRSIDLGLEIANNWYVRGTNGAGNATINTALPNDSAYHGMVLHWQTATFPGPTTVVDEISNSVRTQLGLAATSVALPGALLATRAAATLCWNRTRDAGQGDFLLASGSTTEIFGFRSLASVAGPSMVTPRGLHAAATLNDGRVLFAGGVDGLGAVTANCEIYDPVTNTFTAVAPMPGPRAGGAAATLPSGNVMVVGGTTNFIDLTQAITASLNTTAIYDPVANSWTAGPNIGGRRIVPALTTLNTGRLLISGGIEVTVLFNIPVSVTSTPKAQLYNPATNSWSNAPNMPIGRAYHHDNQVALADGRVLLSGGVLVPDLINAANSAAIANADIYNPATNSWTATTMSLTRTAHTATRMPSGLVIVCGGTQGLVSAPTTTGAVASFDPTNDTWTDLAPLTTPRSAHSAAVLPDGMLVILGGTSVETLRF